MNKSGIDANIDAAIQAHLVPVKPSKSQITQLKIIEAAITCFANDGFDDTSLENIAAECGVSRPLIKHYFTAKEDIILAAAKYVRAHFQKLAIDLYNEGGGTESQFRNYVHSTFLWVKRQRNHAKFFVMFVSECIANEEFNKFHTDLVKMGHKRITAMLAKAESEGLIAKADHSSNAKMIQVVITGALTCFLTEKLSMSIKRLEEITTENCLQVAGYKI